MLRVSLAQPSIHQLQHQAEGLRGMRDHSPLCCSYGRSPFVDKSLQTAVASERYLSFYAHSHTVVQSTQRTIMWIQVLLCPEGKEIQMNQNDFFIFFLSPILCPLVVTHTRYTPLFHFSLQANTAMSLGEFLSAGSHPYSDFSVISGISLYQNPDMLGEAHVCKSKAALQACL